MAFNPRQAQQEAKYAFPYHYLENRSSISGIVYFAYLLRARKLLLSHPAGRVLDAGCGDGRFVAFVHEAAPQCRIEGLDYSESALAFARIYNPQTSFTCADVSAAAWPPGTFDVVTLIEVVEHIIPDQLAAMLAACGRLLAPGGAIIITTPTTNERKMSKAHYQHCTRATITDVLSKAGLRVASIEGNFRDSAIQRLFQGLVQNRLFEIRFRPCLDFYRWCFDRFWTYCPVEKGRRMIVVAEAAAPN